MGITKLMYINKDCDAGGASHLQNALEYVMNPEKTENGRLIGGANCTYATPAMVYQCFNQTKKLYDKTDGRQAYHYVLSLNKGEGNADIMMDIMKDFCKEHLSEYEYVYCVHTDKEHMHGHVIFNSVSCRDGHKYHYKQGDWQKYIQPITNRLCEAYGLSTIDLATEFDYKQGDWKDAMRQDIDRCREHASSYDDFIQRLKAIGYIVHDGPKHKYLTLIPPGKQEAGFKGRRTNKLGDAYSKEALLMYFSQKQNTDRIFSDDTKTLDAAETAEKWEQITFTKYRFYIPDQKLRRLYVDYKKNRQLIRSSYDKKAHLYKQDVKMLEQIMEKEAYLADHKLSTLDTVKEKYADVTKLYRQSQKTYTRLNRILKAYQEVCDLYEAYKDLESIDKPSPETKAHCAVVKAKLEEFNIPADQLDELIRIKSSQPDYKSQMQNLKKEKRLLEAILKDSEQLEHKHEEKKR